MTTLGILGEDRSDTETLKTLATRISPSIGRVHHRGMKGCGELFRKGSRTLSLLQDLGCERFVVCHDADGKSVDELERRVIRDIISPSTVSQDFCVVLPVQAIEAWILANLSCLSNVFTSWSPADVSNPSSVSDPKKQLIRLSKEGKARPRYVPSADNPRAASQLDLDVVESRCPNFGKFRSFLLDELEKTA